MARIEQAPPRVPKVIATNCLYCVVMMSDGVSALPKADEIAVRDIAELVAASMLRERDENGDPPRRRVSPGASEAVPIN